MITVVIADDQGMVRSGLGSLLGSEPDISVVGEAVDGNAAVATVRALRPDVALMDIRMPNLDGIAATRTIVIESPETRVLVLTTFDLDEYVFEALRAGASGFLLKDAPADDLVDGVRVVARGDALLAPAVTRRVVEAFTALPAPATRSAGAQPARVRGPPRTRPRQVDAEIASTLFVSEATVKTHVSSVLGKLPLRDRIQAVVYAYEHGLVRPGEDA